MAKIVKRGVLSVTFGYTYNKFNGPGIACQALKKQLMLSSIPTENVTFRVDGIAMMPFSSHVYDEDVGCSECYSKVALNDKFCSNCGLTLEVDRGR